MNRNIYLKHLGINIVLKGQPISAQWQRLGLIKVIFKPSVKDSNSMHNFDFGRNNKFIFNSKDIIQFRPKLHPGLEYDLSADDLTYSFPTQGDTSRFSGSFAPG